MSETRKNKKAAALSYDMKTNMPPKLTASGKGYVAENILDKAKKHNIPIQEDQTLVELLSQMNINENIPEELYQAVAEVFAYIYQVDKKL
ncbi:EscU/YscU/HrcU family type III secretion system export apparatus switch protein [Aquibacillus saliphilus]|uniref:EscU/YscU/HrcU family type III secretion system export apparatus switch protein n=1 Tax=Aquibacillus saliphilus TaxID=1909422 RepID=UPI001CF020C6|nr:EscU/YscU/HrcU family type III secretion system export apparatus switch protein [Aquibacillus saliphilus]